MIVCLNICQSVSLILQISTQNILPSNRAGWTFLMAEPLANLRRDPAPEVFADCSPTSPEGLAVSSKTVADLTLALRVVSHSVYGFLGAYPKRGLMTTESMVGTVWHADFGVSSRLTGKVDKGTSSKLSKVAAGD